MREAGTLADDAADVLKKNLKAAVSKGFNA